MRLSSFLLRPQALSPTLSFSSLSSPATRGLLLPPPPAGALAPRRPPRRLPRWPPVIAAGSGGTSGRARSFPEPAKESVETPTSASRSSSSSSTASSASSSSSSRSYRRWRFLKDLVHRSKSDGSKRPPPPSPPPPSAAPRRNPSPAASRGRARRLAHERLYEVRRAEAEEMRRRTFLPYRQGLLLDCLGLGSRGYGTMHGLGKGDGGGIAGAGEAATNGEGEGGVTGALLLALVLLVLCAVLRHREASTPWSRVTRGSVGKK